MNNQLLLEEGIQRAQHDSNHCYTITNVPTHPTNNSRQQTHVILHNFIVTYNKKTLKITLSRTKHLKYFDVGEGRAVAKVEGIGVAQRNGSPEQTFIAH
jgi:hypothetical protein